MNKIPSFINDTKEWLRMLTVGVNSIIDGASNAIGSFTCAASQATTTITDLRVGADSVICLMPTTANAAAEMDNIYISTTKQSFTVNHSNNAQIDRIFKYKISG